MFITPKPIKCPYSEISEQSVNADTAAQAYTRAHLFSNKCCITCEKFLCFRCEHGALCWKKRKIAPLKITTGNTETKKKKKKLYCIKTQQNIVWQPILLVATTVLRVVMLNIKLEW